MEEAVRCEPNSVSDLAATTRPSGRWDSFRVRDYSSKQLSGRGNATGFMWELESHTSACATEPRGLTGGYRLPGFVSTASAAESFRSRCGSVRKAPACSSQAFSVAAPQVGQGTDNICFGVSSLVFTTT
jgi:hypothetical protein